MTEETITLEVTRYRPGHDWEPRAQAFAVPFRKDWVVLDALNHIKDRMDGTLSYRWSCRMGVCGSCGMMVNGVPKLTCAAFLRDYHPGPIRVEPLANFPDYKTSPRAGRCSDGEGEGFFQARIPSGRHDYMSSWNKRLANFPAMTALRAFQNALYFN